MFRLSAVGLILSASVAVAQERAKYDRPGGAQRFRVNDDLVNARAVAFSPDDKLLATASGACCCGP
jgi:hypothetical protein